jgi:hypothetical protein
MGIISLKNLMVGKPWISCCSASSLRRLDCTRCKPLLFADDDDAVQTCSVFNRMKTPRYI